MDRVINKAPDRIAGMFDAIAGHYDSLNRFLSVGFDRRWRRRLVDSVVLTETETVLDLCTGTADVAIALCQAKPSCRRVIGVDFSTEMLRHGRNKLNTQDLISKVHLLRADGTAIPLPSGSVDAATIAFGIRNIQNPMHALLEIRRVVRPGGRLIILEFGMPSMPGIRTLYRWYFRSVLPWFGRLASGHDNAYSYLPRSVGEFPSGSEFCQMMMDAGFIETRAHMLQFGIVYLYEGVRPRGLVAE
mgnify:FL=1|tara:strand:- start:329 stop:1063 length:735 start_codon:yes stop_codon:yes gene_type:complete